MRERSRGFSEGSGVSATLPTSHRVSSSSVSLSIKRSDLKFISSPLSPLVKTVPDTPTSPLYIRPWSVAWVSQQLLEDSDRSIGILCTWVHKKRPLEASHETL